MSEYNWLYAVIRSEANIELILQHSLLSEIFILKSSLHFLMLLLWPNSVWLWRLGLLQLYNIFVHCCSQVSASLIRENLLNFSAIILSDFNFDMAIILSQIEWRVNTRRAVCVIRKPWCTFHARIKRNTGCELPLKHWLDLCNWIQEFLQSICVGIRSASPLQLWYCLKSMFVGKRDFGLIFCLLDKNPILWSLSLRRASLWHILTILLSIS